MDIEQYYRVLWWGKNLHLTYIDFPQLIMICQLKSPWIHCKLKISQLKNAFRDFPGSPVVETLPLHTGSRGSTPGQRAKIPHASHSKNQNIKQEAIL